MPATAERVPYASIDTSVNRGQETESSSDLTDLVNYLDAHYEEEGIPQNWWDLEDIPQFNMQDQMRQFSQSQNATPDISLSIARTDKDMRTFCAEYLQYLQNERLVYPYEYIQKRQPDGTIILFDPLYQKAMVDTSNREERNGAIPDTLIDIQSFLVDSNTPVLSHAVMVSPAGASGMVGKNGKPIVYEDSYFFVFEKTQEQTIKGFGLRTNFNHPECAQVLKELSGIDLPPGTPEEQYVRSAALLRSDATPDSKSLTDIVGVLQQTRKQVAEKDYAYKYEMKDYQGKKKDPPQYKSIAWDRVYQDANHPEDVYTLDKEAELFLSECSADISLLHWDNQADPAAIQKRIAATVLRLSRLFIQRESGWRREQEKQSSPHVIYQHEDAAPEPLSFGKVVEDVKSRPGSCPTGVGRSGESAVKGSIEAFLQSHGIEIDETWDYHTGDCVVCGSENVDCGPCDICKVCEKKM